MLFSGFFCSTVSQQFGIAISTAKDTIEMFVDSVLKLMPQLIGMPKTEKQYRSIANDFYKYQYPNVIGAIDGSAIDVIVPSDDRLDFFTRKHRTSVNLTAVCDSHKMFLNINVGHSGRSHDAHIFQCSPLGNIIFAQNLIPDQYHIIGDAAYGLHRNVMIPYPGSDLPAHKQVHNNIHSSTRMVIERAFGDLKNRWLRLVTMRCDVDFAVKIIATCCILHNLCIESGDISPTSSATQNNVNGCHVLDVTSGNAKRDDIARHLHSVHGEPTE